MSELSLRGKKIWSLRSQTIDLDAPKIMGILNVTPDSFSDGGLFLDPEAALERAWQIQEEGADFLDLGAESTRPGAQALPPDEEWRRLKPVLARLAKGLKIPISLDTKRVSTLNQALDFGVEVLNDVSCGKDQALVECAAQARLGYVLMHSRGEPDTMMQETKYRELVPEILAELSTARSRVLRWGIEPGKICIDPGFGFAKTPEQGFQLLQNLSQFLELGQPILVGLSRKRMLREIVGETPEALKAASIAGALLAVQNGASMVRVHDVLGTKAALRTLQKLDAGLQKS